MQSTTRPLTHAEYEAEALSRVHWQHQAELHAASDRTPLLVVCVELAGAVIGLVVSAGITAAGLVALQLLLGI